MMVPVPSAEKKASREVPLESTSFILMTVTAKTSELFVENLPDGGAAFAIEYSIYPD
jgi:hypothetical protein